MISIASGPIVRDRTRRSRSQRQHPTRIRRRTDFDWTDEGRYAHLTPRSTRERELHFRKRQAAKALKLLSKDLKESIRRAAVLLITTYPTVGPTKKPVSPTQMAERLVRDRLTAAMQQEDLVQGIRAARAALSEAWHILTGTKVVVAPAS
jgi:hypothetical protein